MLVHKNSTKRMAATNVCAWKKFMKGPVVECARAMLIFFHFSRNPRSFFKITPSRKMREKVSGISDSELWKTLFIGGYCFVS